MSHDKIVLTRGENKELLIDGPENYRQRLAEILSTHVSTVVLAIVMEGEAQKEFSPEEFESTYAKAKQKLEEEDANLVINPENIRVDSVFAAALILQVYRHIKVRLYNPDKDYRGYYIDCEPKEPDAERIVVRSKGPGDSSFLRAMEALQPVLGLTESAFDMLQRSRFVQEIATCDDSRPPINLATPFYAMISQYNTVPGEKDDADHKMTRYTQALSVASQMLSRVIELTVYAEESLVQAVNEIKIRPNKDWVRFTDPVHLSALKKELLAQATFFATLNDARTAWGLLIMDDNNPYVFDKKKVDEAVSSYGTLPSGITVSTINENLVVVEGKKADDPEATKVVDHVLTELSKDLAVAQATRNATLS